jgi:hypothetical protein
MLKEMSMAVTRSKKDEITFIFGAKPDAKRVFAHKNIKFLLRMQTK